MTTTSPYLLLIETSAIVQTDPNTWRAIAQLGECLLPEVVALETENIAKGKSEGNEANARQFQTMRSQLNWQTTSLSANHPQLMLRTSQNLSAKARMILNIGRCAIGVAHAYPHKCVVLVSDEVLLRDRIVKLDGVDYPNLCAIPSAAARQWSRTSQEPPLVQKASQGIKEATQSTSPPNRSVTLSSPETKQKNINTTQNFHPEKSNFGQIAISLVKYGITAIFLVTILLIGWRTIYPKKFQQFWEKVGLPSFPELFMKPSQPPLAPAKK
ncbi:MAG: hypothetical protein AUK48_00255 [Oscillatoriales cyanobacterium CG2_30_44_21]|nr:MAG: hypothetical protein AUK48_00255 [Oscillatoriales cyanobacterium CG2_30_44_21]